MEREDLLQGYAAAFRSLLWRLKPGKLRRGVQRLIRNAETSAAYAGSPLREALEQVYRRAAQQVYRRLQRRYGVPRSVPSQEAQRRGAAGASRSVVDRLTRLADRLFAKGGPQGETADFWCDAALGGLARWLRAAGYDARWERAIDDDVLLQRVGDGWSILLTTDRPLMQRGVVKAGLVPALWVPPAWNRHQQLSHCVQMLDLPRREPRCMSCGGRLAPVAKAEVATQVPPRTLIWRQDYCRCRRCGKLFWEGTHWQRIDARLAAMREDQRP